MNCWENVGIAVVLNCDSRLEIRENIRKYQCMV